MKVLIPAYKPDEKLLQTIAELHSETDYDIIVVNDGSGPVYDEIFAAIPEYCTVLSHAENRGKGRAMKTGFAHIAAHCPEADGVVIVDADGQHLTPDIKRVCERFAQHPDHIVIGSRQFTGKVPFRSRFGNSLTRVVFALASGVRLSDTQTGLRVIPAQYLESFCDLKGERYEFEMNMLLAAAESGIPMEEVFIETVYIDDNSSSHFNVIRDSFKIYAVIFKFMFSSLLAFLVDTAMVWLLNLLFAATGVTAGLGSSPSLSISVIGARVVSSLVNFFVNRNVVFQNGESVRSTIFKYYALAICILLVKLGIMELFVNILCIPLLLAQIVCEICLFVVSYIVQRKFIFRNKRVA